MKKNKLGIVYLGNFIDFLEFSIFSSLMPLIAKDILGGNESSQIPSLLYFLFFIGFLGRPFGAAVFGFLGDKIGRKTALVISIFGMSVATLAIALVPACPSSYYIIAFIRLLQGFFTGGEYANATVYVIEGKLPQNHFKNAANLTAAGIFGASVGQILGTLVVSSAIPFLEWRYAFVGVSVLSFAVALNRSFRIATNLEPNKPFIKEKLPIPYGQIIKGIALGGLMNGFFYLIYTFLGTFNSLLHNEIFIKPYFISLLSSILFGGMLLLNAKIKYLQQIRPTYVIQFSLLVMLVFIYPMYSELSRGNITSYSIFLMVVFVFFMQMTTLITVAVYPKQFPYSSRVLFSGMSISVGNSLIGGSAPYVSSELIKITGELLSPIIYFISLIIITFLIVAFIRFKQEESSYEYDLIPNR